MIGVLQTGTVLHIQNRHVTREARFVMETLRGDDWVPISEIIHRRKQ